LGSSWPRWSGIWIYIYIQLVPLQLWRGFLATTVCISLCNDLQQVVIISRYARFRCQLKWYQWYDRNIFRRGIKFPLVPKLLEWNFHFNSISLNNDFFMFWMTCAQIFRNLGIRYIRQYGHSVIIEIQVRCNFCVVRVLCPKLVRATLSITI
jgi:hypothetical protein